MDNIEGDRMEIEGQNDGVALFDAHLDLEVIKQRVRAGTLLQGKLMIDRNNILEGNSRAR